MLQEKGKGVGVAAAFFPPFTLHNNSDTMSHHPKIILPLFLIMFLLVACDNAELEATVVPLTSTLPITKAITATATSPILTPLPSTTLLPTNTPTIIPTDVPTETPTAIPTPTIPSWVHEGTAVPQPEAIINPENASQLTQLARWGRGVIHDVAYSGDGRWLAVSTATGIYLHNAQNLAQTERWIRTTPVDRIAFSPDSRLIAGVMPRHGVDIWQTEDGQWVRTIAENAREVKFSPDGEILALLLEGPYYSIQLWSLRDNTQMIAFADSASIAFSPVEPIYAVGARAKADRTTYIHLYQITDHKLLQTTQIGEVGSREDIASLTFSPEGQHLILGRGFRSYGNSGIVEVRQINGDLVYSIEGVPPQPKTPYFCDSDLTGFEGPYLPAPTRIVVSPDGQQFSIIYEESIWGWTTNVHRLADGQLLYSFGTDINSLTYTPDGQTFVTGSQNGNLYIWQGDNQQLEQGISAYNAPISGIFFSPDGQTVAVESPYSVQLYDMLNGTLLREIPTAIKVAFSSDGTQLALGFEDGRIEVHDLINNVLVYQITELTSSIQELVFTPDNQHLIAIAQCTNHIYQASDGVFLHALEDYVTNNIEVGETRVRIGDIAVSADSRTIIGWLVGASHFGLWEMGTGKLIGVYPSEEIAGVWRFISAPGKAMFAGLGGTYPTTDFSFWDMSNGDLQFEWSGPDRGNYYYWHLAINPAENLLTASSNQGTVDIWYIERQELLTSLPIDTFVHRVDILFATSLAFSPDGRFLVTGTSNGLIHVWGVP